MAQEPRVAAADADAGEQRRRAEEQHDEEVPPALASRGRPTVRRRRLESHGHCSERLRELQLLERAHVGPDEVDRQQVRQAEGPVVEEAREGPPALKAVEARRDEARTTMPRDRGGLGC